MVVFQIVLSLFAIILLSILPVVLSSARKRRMLRNMPGMKEVPVLGHALYYLNKSPAQIMDTVWRAFGECGRVWKMFLLHDVQVVVSDPKVCELMLSGQKYMHKSMEYFMTRSWLGDGLLLSMGKKWQGRRRAITPAFHFKILEQFVEVFDRNSRILVDIIGKNKETDPVDVFPLITLTALDIICETSMGRSVNAQKNSSSAYVQAVQDIATVLHLRMTSVKYRNDFLYKFSSLAKKEKQSLKILHDFTDSVIVARRQELLDQDTTEDTQDTNDDLGMKKKRVLLDVLLQSTIDGKPLTNADIREEVDTFMFEGHDTTTSAVTFGLYCLAKHPEVQRKVIQEIHEVIGEDKAIPHTQQKMNDMPYYDAVIKECLRLYSPVPFVGRYMEEDTDIGDYIVPKGASLILGIMFMHQDPELYPEPKKFKPERFLENRLKENAYSYIPFSAGSRNCIGQKFAILEMKTIISTILRHFEISVDPSYKEPLVCGELVIKPQNGMVLNFKPRKIEDVLYF